jgi:preflagellin peptidase FlaK
LEPSHITQSFSILLSLVFFAVGSAFDIKTREVPDWVWLAYGPTGLLLTAIGLFLNPSEALLAVLSIALTTVLAIALVYFGVFGGADAKALICLGITLPLAPSSYVTLVGYVHPYFPVPVVIMGFVCSVSVVFWIGLRNLWSLSRREHLFEGLGGESMPTRVLAALTGYPTDISKLRSTFYLYPVEEVVEDTTGARRRFHLFFSAETDRDQMISDFTKSLSKVGSPSRVWVSPGLPMLLFMFVGLVITLITGDLIFSTILMFALH